MPRQASSDAGYLAKLQDYYARNQVFPSYAAIGKLIGLKSTSSVSAFLDRLIADGLTPFARWGEADDVGRAVAVMAAGDLPFVTGDALNVDGGLHIHKL